MRVYSHLTKMTAEEIYIKLKDELTAENESSSSPERIFIKHDSQTICTLGMNRSHEIIFVEFKPSSKDLSAIEREGFVHPHPVEMLHDAGWRQAQLTSWEEAEKLLEIIQRSYKRKKTRTSDEAPRKISGRRPSRPIIPLRPAVSAATLAAEAPQRKKGKAARPAAKKAKIKTATKTRAKVKPKAAPKAKAKASKKKAAPKKAAKKKGRK
jgi:hypothetical protein